MCKTTMHIDYPWNSDGYVCMVTHHLLTAFPLTVWTVDLMLLSHSLAKTILGIFFGTVLLVTIVSHFILPQEKQISIKTRRKQLIVHFSSLRNIRRGNRCLTSILWLIIKLVYFYCVFFFLFLFISLNASRFIPFWNLNYLTICSYTF